jgi:predicted ATP-grasp superfamily ATP-dependent carboligase
VTEQQSGESWLHAKPFGYCGNISVDPDRMLAAKLERVARVVATHTGLTGVWGLDFILKDGDPYPVEVNPRYTAGMEVVELAARFAALRVHRDCFTSTASRFPLPQPVTVVGKAIYFAPRAFAFPNAGPWDADLAGEFDPWGIPGFADIPVEGERFEAGQPVITFFAEGSTSEEVRAKLQVRAVELDHLFEEHSP